MQKKIMHFSCSIFLVMYNSIALQVMFTWWISWVWTWVLCCPWPRLVAMEGVWAAGNNPNYNKHLSQQQLQAQLLEAASSSISPGVIPALSGLLKKEMKVGPGMGGSAVQAVGQGDAQYFATQPTPQTAVVGSTAVLPCR